MNEAPAFFPATHRTPWLGSLSPATLCSLGLSAMLLSTVTAACQGPGPRKEISVRCPTSTAILGEPFGEMQVTWTPSEPMVLPIQPMASSPDLWVEIETPSGKIGPYQKGDVLPSLPERPLFLAKAGDRLEWTIGYGDFSQSLCSPGTYHIRFWYRVNPGWWNYKELWKGEAASNEVTIRIEQPAGPDKVLWDRFRATVPNGSCWQFKNWIENHGGEVLKDFPASTYAAYVIFQPPFGMAAGEEGQLIRSLETGTYLSSCSYPDDTGKSKDGWRSLGGEGAVKWREKWIGIILKNHPDIWFADALRLKLAIDQVALKNYQAGAADLEQLCSTAKPEVAARAKVYLDLIKQKGWIKE